jgi:hypothetical protein
MASQASAGQGLVDRIVADLEAQGLEPDSKDAELLDVAADIVDRIAVLEAAVEADGLSTTLKDGRIVLHPAICEIRQQHLVLVRTLKMIQTEPADTKDPKKVRAAQEMWRQRRVGH